MSYTALTVLVGIIVALQLQDCNVAEAAGQRGKECELSNELENGFYIDRNGNRVQSIRPYYVVLARCDLGYGRIGNEYRRCDGATGKLQGESADCIDINECLYNDLGSEGSSWEPSSQAESVQFSFNVEVPVFDQEAMNLSSCHFFAQCLNTPGSYMCKCDKGYEGDGVNTCTKIARKPCETLKPPLFGSMEKVSEFRVRFKCDKGYRIYGYEYRNCVDGQWKGSHPKCEVDGCGDPGTPINGFKHGDDYTVGSRVFFGCNEGFDIIGPTDMECLPGNGDQWSSDYWSGGQTRCRRKAQSIGDIADNLQVDFVDRLEVFTHSGRGRLALSDNIGLDLVFAYDTSTSLQRFNFERGVNFTESLLRHFGVSYDRGGTRVAAISFSSVATLEFGYGPDVNTTEAVMERINQLKDKLGGGTALGKALIEVYKLTADMRNSSKKALFVVTDGMSTAKEDDPAAIAESLRIDKDMEIFVVAVGEGIDRQQLRQIASQPYSTHVFLLENFDDLAELTAIISETGAEYKRCGQAGNLELPRSDQGRDAEFNANPKAWPWLAQILRVDGNDTLLECGGALLCDDWVLTSGSCVFNETKFVALPPEIFRVRLGAYEVGVTEEDQQEFFVSEVHLHEDFDTFNRINDIALIKLDRSVNLTSSARTLCVPTEIEIAQWTTSSLCYIAGWGFPDPIEEQPRNKNSPPVYPKQFPMHLVNDEQCRLASEFPFRFNERKMCAGKRYKSNPACRGDRGGPLVCQQFDSSWAVAGVTSYSWRCTEYNEYAIFTRIIEFLPWIHHTTGNCTAAHEAQKVGGFNSG